MTEMKRNQPEARRIAKLACPVRAAALLGTIMLTISTMAQSSEVSLVIQNACRAAVAQQTGSMAQTDIDNICKCVSDTVLGEISAADIQSTKPEALTRSTRDAYKSCRVKMSVVPQEPSRKNDIQGIRLGMTEEEAKTVVIPGKRPSLVFTKSLEPPRICEVKHVFQSGTAPREMISIVSEQFKMTPIKADWSAEIAHATTSRLEPFTTMWGTTKMVAAVGGLIAQWHSDGLALELTLNYPAIPNAPNEYILKLVDEELKKRDIVVAKAKRDAGLDAQRAINPQPKF